ncbi:hypothetical protein [Nocardioides jejuensis]|uniref:Permease n=1 Tax=Nocardioides jejuensis TaxID=2502782 RepID=A0A4R1CLI5_9ACTN|nr:hypothetical protein [Nocardioides jejuensis]TCJ31086.1 hypothetical protein EPD65_00485 [Nocardioides jejuensis]
MTDDTTLSGTAGTSGSDKAKGGLRSFALAVGLLVFLGVCALIGFVIATLFGFKMWANFLGHRIDGSMVNGTLWGLSLGFVCTLIPLIIARQALRGFGFGVRLTILAFAAIVALPNIATLAIRFGSSHRSEVARNVLETDGNGVITGTYVGITIGVGVFLLLVVWGVMRWNDKRKTRKLSRKLAEMAGDAADSAD